MERFGGVYRELPGYAVENGYGKHRHYWGGESWAVTPKREECDVDFPAQLLTLDLRDPCLKKLQSMNSSELPLFSFINSNAWEGTQIYRLVPHEKRIELLNCNPQDVTLSPAEISYSLPFPERVVFLRRLEIQETPLTEESYWNCCDQLLGGGAFIRVLQPLWMLEEETYTCDCRNTMTFVACIGHESLGSSNGIVNGRPFFIGEGVLYYFFCVKCLTVLVTMQST